MGVEGVYREGQGHCDLSSNDSIGEYFLLRFNHCWISQAPTSVPTGLKYLHLERLRQLKLCFCCKELFDAGPESELGLMRSRSFFRVFLHHLVVDLTRQVFVTPIPPCTLLKHLQGPVSYYKLLKFVRVFPHHTWYDRSRHFHFSGIITNILPSKSRHHTSPVDALQTSSSTNSHQGEKTRDCKLFCCSGK